MLIENQQVFQELMLGLYFVIVEYQRVIPKLSHLMKKIERTPATRSRIPAIIDFEIVFGELLTGDFALFCSNCFPTSAVDLFSVCIDLHFQF